MTRMAAIALILLVGGDGGKVQWRSGKDHDAALIEAKSYGTPLFLYFWDGLPACKALDAGVLSDPDVVKVSERLIRVIIRGTELKLFEKYRVKAAPAFLFLDPDGEVIRSVTSPENNAGALTSMMVEVAESATRGPRWQEHAAAALEIGRNDTKPVFLVFPDGKKDAQTFLRTFGDATYKGLWSKFACAKIPWEKDSDDCKRWKAGEASTVVIVDVRGAEPKILKSIKGPLTPKLLRKELDEALKKFESTK